ncbi:MAG: PDZ domain-containing protein, partial [Candidatus Sabulitectum sp.]|nr:PDZ domain-containing protein [Candidatus Sabulitectum sp.]
EYHTFSGFRHDPSYLPRIEDRVMEFLSETERIRFPDRIIWEAGEPSGCDWLMVDSIISWPLIGEDRDYNTILVSDRLQFGFYPDREYEGNGVLIAGTLDGDVPAVRLELTEGDIITGFMNEPVKSLEDIGILQSEMHAGDWFSIEIQRDGETIYLEDSFNPPEYYWLFPRDNPSVRVEAAYSGNQFDISVNRLCDIRLLLHPEMVDFNSDIVVTCNGLEIFNGKVTEDGNFAMNNIMEHLDMERCYTAELILDLEELMPSLMYHRTDTE